MRKDTRRSDAVDQWLIGPLWAASEGLRPVSLVFPPVVPIEPWATAAADAEPRGTSPDPPLAVRSTTMKVGRSKTAQFPAYADAFHAP